MNTYAKSADAYLAQRILGASPEQQAALIMEAGQLHLGKAIQSLTQNDLPAASHRFTRFSEVLMAANLRLDLEDGGELAQNLEKLYNFWNREIIIASHAKDMARLGAVVRGMGEIRQAWEEFHQKKTGAGGSSTFQLGDQVV